MLRTSGLIATNTGSDFKKRGEPPCFPRTIKEQHLALEDNHLTPLTILCCRTNHKRSQKSSFSSLPLPCIQRTASPASCRRRETFPVPSPSGFDRSTNSPNGSHPHSRIHPPLSPLLMSAIFPNPTWTAKTIPSQKNHAPASRRHPTPRFYGKKPT